MQRRKIIAGNWKMYKTAEEAQVYAAQFLEALGDATAADVVICAPYTALPALKNEFEESLVHLGAQNMFWADEGAYTGEISAKMLLELACTYVILGHSERREILLESDELIAKKLKAALAAGLTPILCVGENLVQREGGKAMDIVRTQVQKGVEGLSRDDLQRVVIAYEPIWAIGTGKTASSEDAQQMCAGIRATVAAIDSAAAQIIPILYGGSVKVNNIRELMSQADIDGGLVGGASLEPQGFADLVHQAC